VSISAPFDELLSPQASSNFSARVTTVSPMLLGKISCLDSHPRKLILHTPSCHIPVTVLQKLHHFLARSQIKIAKTNLPVSPCLSACNKTRNAELMSKKCGSEKRFRSTRRLALIFMKFERLWTHHMRAHKPFSIVSTTNSTESFVRSLQFPR
jgi:hypothetical protein